MDNYNNGLGPNGYGNQNYNSGNGFNTRTNNGFGNNTSGYNSSLNSPNYGNSTMGGGSMYNNTGFNNGSNSVQSPYSSKPMMPGQGSYGQGMNSGFNSGMNSGYNTGMDSGFNSGMDTGMNMGMDRGMPDENTSDVFTGNNSFNHEEPEEDKKAVIKRRVILGLKITALVSLVVILVGCIVVYVKYGAMIKKCYDEAQEKLADSGEEKFKEASGSRFYDSNGNEIEEMSMANENYLEDNEIPQVVKDTFVVSEDKDFYNHHGISYKGNIRAVFAIIQNGGKLAQGGSTITQQLTRNIFLSFEKSMERKIKEIFIARGLEEEYSKDQILEFYINNIYFANSHTGVESAAQGYFGKSINECSLAQQVYICAIPNNPTLYNPYVNPDKTEKRKQRLLKQLNADGKITDAEYEKAVKEEVVVDKVSKDPVISIQLKNYIEYCAVRTIMEQSDFEFRCGFTPTQKVKGNDGYDEYMEYVNYYNDNYKEALGKLQKRSLRVYTSIDLDAQEKLQRFVDTTLADNTEIYKDNVYNFQGSAACLDNETGKIIAIVGGRTQDDVRTEFSRAYEDYRQPGSAIKPLLVYGPALDIREEDGKARYSIDYHMMDQKITEEEYPFVADLLEKAPDTKIPENSSKTYANAEVTFKEAIGKSLNTIPWLLLHEIGTKYAINYLEKMNFYNVSVEDTWTLNAALGGFRVGTNPVEMCAAYATIENEGCYRKPSCILKITENDSEDIVADGKQGVVEIYDVNTTKQLITGMKTVLEEGYGTARKLGIKGQDCAAKTGTTNGYVDAWMCGFSKYYTTCVWTGQDDRKTCSGNSGAAYAGKIWHDFMEEMHVGKDRADFDTEVIGLEFVKQDSDKTQEELFEEWKVIYAEQGIPEIYWYDLGDPNDPENPFFTEGIWNNILPTAEPPEDVERYIFDYENNEWILNPDLITPTPEPTEEPEETMEPEMTEEPRRTKKPGRDNGEDDPDATEDPDNPEESENPDNPDNEATEAPEDNNDNNNNNNNFWQIW
ncbi:MAG: transglycosylase domain-containing protein [Lachnospiraceae bacterium]|nr:transglycosylase domain-containing protein [Lachnospiraceae bacterium]